MDGWTGRWVVGFLVLGAAVVYRVTAVMDGGMGTCDWLDHAIKAFRLSGCEDDRLEFGASVKQWPLPRRIRSLP